MDKVIRRTALARNQSKRKAIIKAKEAERASFKEALRTNFARRRVELDAIRSARERRREDWLRGPLAPRRDVGLDGRNYGALQPDYTNPPKIPKHLRRKYINIAPGDRVCVVRGKDKGKIGEVSRVDPETETVTSDTLNMANVCFPDWLVAAYRQSSNIQPLPLPIPIDDVRLVVPLDDPETGNNKDVIVEHTYGGEPILEREWGSSTPKHTRYIAGEDIEIPWPRSDLVIFRDEEWDTLRMEVETPSWLPSLLDAPFPPSVMDELRNKFSKYRTRHDPEWVEAKKMEDLRKEYLQTRSMMMPRTELAALKRSRNAEKWNSQRDTEGNLIMSTKTADFIRKFMERNAEKKSRASGS